MKCVSKAGLVIVLTILTAGTARAAVILDISSALALTDPVQLGRLSRNGIPQDWSGGEPFPGVINPTVAYRYHAYVVNVGLTPFIQINVDSVSTNTFFSAYDTTYAPNSAGAPNLGFDINWLGDAGVSGNDFGINPLFFQVAVPPQHNLLIVVNNTAAGNVGVGDPFRLLVEGFVDSAFTDPPGVPEPGAFFLTGSGALALLVRRRRRRMR